MQLKYYAVVLYLLPVFAIGQSSTMVSTAGQSPIHGIKVKSSGFDPGSRVVRLVFINDAPTDITAWGYCVNTQTTGTVRHGFCTLVDALPTVIEHNIEVQKRPFLPEPQCHGCQVIHPGQEETISSDYSQYPDVSNASITIDLIAFSNGAVEHVANETGETDMHDLTARRQRQLQEAQKVIAIGKQILADPTDPHPASTMIHTLEAANDSASDSLLDEFKKPEKHAGNEREFVPQDERTYLDQFIKQQEMRAAILSRNQIKEVL